jgi:ribosomal-protein-alanine N-acetyltransferase
LTTIKLRDAIEDDLQAIHMIEDQVYSTPWTLNFIRIIFHINKDLFIVASKKDEIIGYAIGEIKKIDKNENPKKAGHVLNIAVKSQFQGVGVGTKLLDKLEQRFTNKGANISYLEVRESNELAQRVYRNRGYVYVRTVENYYGDEHGIIMTKKMNNEPLYR